MEMAEALEFVRGHGHAVLATTRRDGTPQMSPVTAVVDAAGRVVVSTGEDSAKTRNLLRDPRAWLCVLSDGFYGPWVQVGGEVEVVRLPEAMEPLVEYYRTAAGEHPDWAEYRAAMVRERRVLLRLTPSTAGPGGPR